MNAGTNFGRTLIQTGRRESDNSVWLRLDHNQSFRPETLRTAKFETININMQKT